MVRYWQTAIVTALLAALVACSPDSRIDDLRTFVAEAHEHPKPVVEPLPDIEPYTAFQYTAADLADPFSPANLGQSQAVAAGPSPDSQRRREPLEHYPLDSLTMLGTLFRGSTAWLIVRAPDGTIYTPKPGSYMGTNSGQIRKITEDSVKIAELVPGPSGGWVERDVNIALAH